MTEPAKAQKKPPRQRIIDVDVHVSDTPQELAPFCEMPWRKSLEILAKVPQRYLDIPGFSPNGRLDPPLPGGQTPRSVRTPQEMREGLDALGITEGILIPDNLLLFAVLPNQDYATALCNAYNRWLAEKWVDEKNGLIGAIMACPQNPEETVKEIERYATLPGMKAIYLPTAGVNPLWGHRKYDRVHAAAQAADLPVILHSVTIVNPVFPANIEQFENHYGRQLVGHNLSMMANMASIMHTGVPARFPKLKMVFAEAGVSWVPHMMWRMDKYHQEYRRLVPFLEERPSDYIKRQMWFATQPVEEPDVPAHLLETIMHYGGEDRTVFASDWPHHDFDHPRALMKVPFTPEQRQKVLWKNAAELFKLPEPASLQEPAIA